MAYQEKWGREKARERYGSEGMKKMADGGDIPPLPISPVSGPIQGPKELSTEGKLVVKIFGSGGMPSPYSSRDSHLWKPLRK